MKKIIAPFVLGALIATCVRADTPLTIDGGSPFICFENANVFEFPPAASGSFTLPGVIGTGTVSSSVPADTSNFGVPPTPDIYDYNYNLDLSGMSSATNHCIKLLIHFGAPDGCGSDVIWASPANIQSASLATYGDITVVFNSGCLQPGQGSGLMQIFTGAGPVVGTVTVIDDYVDPASGTTNEFRTDVTALVPDIPPDPKPYHFNNIPYYEAPWWVQGFLGPNTPNPGPLFNGSYDFQMQLMDAQSNGYAVSQVVTQAVQVANGLFNMPSPFDPSSLAGGLPRWLSIAVRPTGSNVAFTPLNPPLAITPSPQAFYAFTAGTVADLGPGQAVTSLNGLTDAVILQGGNGIIWGTNGNTLTISAPVGGPSDRNLKTGFISVNTEAILSRLATLPIASWRFTNEVAGTRHLGPMAQDFKAAFGLGNDDKIIGYLDASGVALSAIQGLNQKLDDKGAEIQKLEQQHNALEQRLDALEQRIKSMNEKE